MSELTMLGTHRGLQTAIALLWNNASNVTKHIFVCLQVTWPGFARIKVINNELLLTLLYYHRNAVMPVIMVLDHECNKKYKVKIKIKPKLAQHYGTLIRISMNRVPDQLVLPSLILSHPAKKNCEINILIVLFGSPPCLPLLSIIKYCFTLVYEIFSIRLAQVSPIEGPWGFADLYSVLWTKIK